MDTMSMKISMKNFNYRDFYLKYDMTGEIKIGTGIVKVHDIFDELPLFMKQADCEIAAFCDVYQPYSKRDRSQVLPRYIETMGNQIPRMGEKFTKQPVIYKDYRKLLEDKSIDAVCKRHFLLSQIDRRVRGWINDQIRFCRI